MHHRHHQEVSQKTLSSSEEAPVVAGMDPALAAATASAEAVAEEAEREAEGVAPPKATEVKKPVALASAKAKVTHAKKDDDDEEDDEEDDGDDEEGDDDDEEAAAPSAPAPVVVTAAPKPKPGQEMESLTPAGKVTKARNRLQDNLKRQAEIAAEIALYQGESTQALFDSKVDAEAKTVAGETQTKALASVLGSMRKEMRKFAAPFYLEHLVDEQRQLKAAELQLEAELDSAQGKTGKMMESLFRPGAPAAGGLRGTAEPEQVPAERSAAAKISTMAAVAVAAFVALTC